MFKLSLTSQKNGMRQKTDTESSTHDRVKAAPGAPPIQIPRSLDSEALVKKTVKDVMLKPRPHWVGDGFHVLPVFNRKAFTRDVSPFLMFDYAAPKEFNPAKGKLGVGQHPHRGFETVTIAWQGEVEHGDHLGNRDVIHAGDVQWMTAARGIIHEEYHSREFAKTGGKFEMCQLWVNLPKKHKMDAARYQPITATSIPTVPLPSGAGYVRVIAGSYGDAIGPSMTFSPIDMWEVRLHKCGGCTDLVFPEGQNTIIFVRQGAAAVGAKEQSLSAQDVALMGETGRQVPVRALADDTMLLILSGQPFDEPIAARGPFCMNTAEELQQASEDYMSRKNGFGRR
jgi:redox-sensitive bicupin YhaK (pirin superfamily)